MKTVKIINPRTSEAVTVETYAVTWGELLNELQDHNSLGEIDYDNSKIFMKDSERKSTLGLPSDALSSEDYFKIFVSPIKMKAGTVRYTAGTIKELQSKVNNLFADVLEDIANANTRTNSNEVTAEDLDDYDSLMD